MDYQGRLHTNPAGPAGTNGTNGTDGTDGTDGTGGDSSGTVVYSAGEILAAGQPVALSYEMAANNVVVTTVIRIFADTPPYLVIGVTAAAALAGENVTVILNGICGARFNFDGTWGLVYYTPVQMLLNQDAPLSIYDVLVNKGLFQFTDNGGISGNYSNSQNHYKIFDAGVGRSWNLEFKDTTFLFEHSAGSYYDRLYVEGADAYSDFGNSNTNPVIMPWALGTSSTNFSSSSPNPSSGAVRNVLPASFNNAVASSGNKAGATSTTVVDPNGIIADYEAIFHNSGKRFIRFTFISDSSSNYPGWDINLRSVEGTPTEINPAYVSGLLPEVGQPMYVDTVVDYRDVTAAAVTPFKIGYCVQAPLESDTSILIHRSISGE
jgi:hypothetical protein